MRGRGWFPMNHECGRDALWLKVAQVFLPYLNNTCKPSSPEEGPVACSWGQQHTHILFWLPSDFCLQAFNDNGQSMGFGVRKVCSVNMYWVPTACHVCWALKRPRWKDPILPFKNSVSVASVRTQIRLVWTKGGIYWLVAMKTPEVQLQVGL